MEKVICAIGHISKSNPKWLAADIWKNYTTKHLFIKWSRELKGQQILVARNHFTHLPQRYSFSMSQSGFLQTFISPREIKGSCLLDSGSCLLFWSFSAHLIFLFFLLLLWFLLYNELQCYLWYGLCLTNIPYLCFKSSVSFLVHDLGQHTH